MTSPTAPARPGFPYQRLLKDGVIAMVLNVMVAVIITLASGGRHFLQNLVISMCIGTLAYLIIDIARLSIWGEGVKVNWKIYGLILIGAAPVAQIGGGLLADLLLGANLSPITSPSSRTTLNYMLLTLMMTSGATIFFAIRDRLNRAETEAALDKARAEATRRQTMQAQLQLLQAQIEPHMLFNTLANLQGMIALDPERAQAMLDQLIQYLRATLSSSRAHSTTLAQEFALIDAYLGLMSVRMGARLAYTLELPAALRAQSIAPMLLQPLVENAIIHGLEPHIDGGQVHVSARVDAGLLDIRVSDTGLGLDAARAGSSGTGLGVANTRERLLALYGAQAGLTLAPNPPGGAVARLTFPIDPS